ncbi:lymphokine-activated killer T-cell-originated protein kinase [Neocloeon triangulifer]|uniref:lymphokine-activated killer T-cell-originated protein kinase n=1 Tax=Neocloeon triangulifer TaxID=2078957 RepID=UPI00286FAC08|nr:lymphokine-activated killer T-cell-originated protein kinase [Neocloeon triangulifer]
MSAADTPIVSKSKTLDNSGDFKTPTRKRTSDKLNASFERTPIPIPPSPLLEKLGFGTGVTVFKINRKLPESGVAASPWAVKRLMSKTKTNPILSARLEKEANILQKLDHPNIVGFRKLQKQSDGRLCLAMEEGGSSLMDLIETRKEEVDKPFPAEIIMRTAVDIAMALCYLHEEHKLVHGDIKSQNILIKGDFKIAKLCDFGTSLPIGEGGVVQGEYHCSEPWSAPELVGFFEEDEENDSEKKAITDKADIFSYGLVLYEMLALTTPHFNIEDSSKSFNEDSFYDRLGTRPDLPDIEFDSSYNDILGIFYLCTEKDPESRPSAKRLVEILSGEGQ